MPSKPAPLPIPPPADLSESSQALWRQLVPRRCKSPERLELLTVALRCRDRLEQIRDMLQTDGLTTTTAGTGVKHLSPTLKAEFECRRQLATLWTALGLDYDGSIDGIVR